MMLAPSASAPNAILQALMRRQQDRMPEGPGAGGMRSSLARALLGALQPQTSEDLALSVLNPLAGLASNVTRGIAARRAGQAASEASPGILKWVMDRNGRVIFAPAGVYHETMIEPSRRWAGGVIEGGRVNVYGDLSRASRSAFDAIKQAVATAFREAGY